MNTDVMFSSASTHYQTPHDLKEALYAEFDLNFDPCPIGGTEGLTLPWGGNRVFCNPPYGRGIGDWLRKAREADVAVYLLPARTDTKWWHEYAMQADEIRFLRGRLRFPPATNSAPFPSVILIYLGAK